MFDFYDEKLKIDFNRNGYVVVDLFSIEEINYFKQVYQENRNEHLIHQNVLHSTADTANFDLIKRIHQQVVPHIEQKLQLIMKDFGILVSGFLTKIPGENSSTSFHQDPTLVDEDIACSGNLWVPLQEVHENNGQLVVIPGSHRLGKNLRVTPDCPLYYRNYRDQLLGFSEPIPLKVGQAVILNHRMIHGSTNNNEQERVALVTAIKSNSELPWDFYYKDPENSEALVEHYHITFDSFSKLKKNKRPVDSVLINTLEVDFPNVPWIDFLRFMKKEYKKASNWEILKAYFSNNERA